MENYESYDLTDEQWERIRPLLPPEIKGKKGRPRKDDRMMLNGMLWMNHSGAQWRQLPVRYGPWQSVYARFAKWRDEGIWENIFSELSWDADIENLSIDSTCVKVHESSKETLNKWSISSDGLKGVQNDPSSRQLLATICSFFTE